MVAWLAPLITAGVTAASSYMNQDDTQSGSETTSQQPGSYTDMQGGQDIWDMAMSAITGGPSGNSTSDPAYWSERERALGEDLSPEGKDRLGFLNNNIELSKIKKAAYEKFKVDGDKDALYATFRKGTSRSVENDPTGSTIASALLGGPFAFGQTTEKDKYIIPKDEIDRVAWGKIPIDQAIAYNDWTYYQRLKEEEFPQLKGMYSTASSTGGEVKKAPTLLEMMTEDYNAKVKASDTYLSQQSGVDKTLMDELNGTTGAYQQDLTGYKNTLNTPAFYLNMGGKNVGVVPRGTRDNVSLLSDLSQAGYNAGVNKANTGYQVGSNAATRNLTQAETYTPNAGNISYIKDTLLPLALKLNDTRYGLPSQTQTGSLTSTPSFLEKLSNTSNIVTPLIQMLQNSFGNKSGSTGTTDGKTLQELYPGISING